MSAPLSASRDRRAAGRTAQETGRSRRSRRGRESGSRGYWREGHTGPLLPGGPRWRGPPMDRRTERPTLHPL